MAVTDRVAVPFGRSEGGNLAPPAPRCGRFRPGASPASCEILSVSLDAERPDEIQV